MNTTTLPDPPRRTLRPAALILAICLLSSAITSSVTALARLPNLAGPAATGTPAGESGVGSGTTVSVTPAPSGNASTRDPIIDVAALVSPAVVTITASGTTARGPFDIPSTGVGSGVIFRADGWILTNAHVVEVATELVVALRDGRELPGRVVEIDSDLDLAVVKVDAAGLPTAALGQSADLDVGELVIAIGSPLGEFSGSVTSGILSAVGRSIEVPDERGRAHSLTDLLQTDAAINPGNSGGPLLDTEGRVIGINTAIAASANGIGFAIPIDRAADIIAAAIGNASI